MRLGLEVKIASVVFIFNLCGFGNYQSFANQQNLLISASGSSVSLIQLAVNIVQSHTVFSLNITAVFQSVNGSGSNSLQIILRSKISRSSLQIGDGITDDQGLLSLILGNLDKQAINGSDSLGSNRGLENLEGSNVLVVSSSGGFQLIGIIAIIGGDSDFIDPIEFAKREGIQVYLNHMGLKVKDELIQSCDFELK